MDAQVLEERSATVLSIAEELYAQKVDWIDFFRQILGVDGHLRRLFPSSEEYAVFETTPAYAKIQEYLALLRQVRRGGESAQVLTVITVRLPKDLHLALRAEAHERKTSMNQLCVAKLLLPLNDPAAETYASDATT
jgi:hypothetical protein